MLSLFDQKFTITAKTFEGLEPVLAKELEGLGAKEIAIKKRAVSFLGDKKLLYKSNYALRSALSILVPIHQFRATNGTEFYKGVSQINWTQLFTVKDTLSVNSTVNSQFFNHSKYISLKTKDAVVDQFRRRKGKRPNVDTLNPTIKINVYISQADVTISLDSSGDPLYKRGYRINGYIAPINEVLAAGMVLLSGWKGQSDLIDPMCGSGTILIEAALIANKIPPGMYRQNFGFENWQNFDPDLMDDIADECDETSDFKHSIYGSDISSTATELALLNIKNASLENNCT